MTSGPASVDQSPPGLYVWLENAVLGLLVVFTVLVVLAQVFTRYVVNQPLTWSGEVATDLLVWISFMGMSVALRDHAHVAMAVISERFPKRLESAIAIVQLLVVATFLILLIVGGLQLIASQFGETSPAQIPIWVPYASIPVGATLGLLHVSSHIRHEMRPVLASVARRRV